jgi:hypothetical protein
MRDPVIIIVGGGLAKGVSRFQCHRRSAASTNEPQAIAPQ